MENLNMRKIATQWESHFHLETEKQRQVTISKELLVRLMDEGEIMFKHVVSFSETWIRSFEPELKRQSSEWNIPNYPRPVKFHRSLNNPKMLMIFAFDYSGVFTSHRVPQRQTVNIEYYKYFLRLILRPALPCK